MRLSLYGARSAAVILFDNSMCRPVADGIEVLRSKYIGLLGQFTVVKTDFKEIAHLWRLVRVRLGFLPGAPTVASVRHFSRASKGNCKYHERTISCGVQSPIMFATFVPWCRTDLGVVPLRGRVVSTERQDRSRFATRQLLFQAPSTGFLGHRKARSTTELARFPVALPVSQSCASSRGSPRHECSPRIFARLRSR